MSFWIAVILQFLLSLVILLPLRDRRGPGKRFPLGTLLLIATNTAVHIFITILWPARAGVEDPLHDAFYGLMLRPIDIWSGMGLGALSMITSSFMHADWSHLIGNMVYLYFFGRKVEDLMGTWRFLLFYMVTVFTSSIAGTLIEAVMPVTAGRVPGLGASGAVTALLGAYLFLYSEQRIQALLFVAIIPIPIPVWIPVWVYALHHIGGDIVGGWLSQEFQSMGYLYQLIGFFDHLGGFIGGMTAIYLFLPPEVVHYRYRGQGSGERQV